MRANRSGRSRVKRSGRNLVYECDYRVNGQLVTIDGTGSSEMQARYAIKAHIERLTKTEMAYPEFINLPLRFVKDKNNDPIPGTPVESIKPEAPAEKPETTKPKWIQGKLNFEG